MHLLHGGTLNSRRAARPLIKLAEKGEKRDAPDSLQVILPQNWGRTKSDHTVTCIMLKATANYRRTFSLLRNTEQRLVNTSLYSNTSAIGDGPRSFEHRSSNENDTRAGILNYSHNNGRTLSFDKFNELRPFYSGSRC
ncbi:hypothetical protein TNCV_4984151 [Trichonephila clavipes]|nr:hypothetical protein TNCV_4984151 [Trichonephila clavipes]